MIIVDTTVWIDYFRGVFNPQTNWLDRESARQPLGLLDLNLCEILQGIRDEALYRRVRTDLLRFSVYATGGAALAVSSADNYRVLRSRGYTVRKTIDCLIATYCINEGHALLHRDRDFDAFERELGLSVIHP